MRAIIISNPSKWVVIKTELQSELMWQCQRTMAASRWNIWQWCECVFMLICRVMLHKTVPRVFLLMERIALQRDSNTIYFSFGIFFFSSSSSFFFFFYCYTSFCGYSISTSVSSYTAAAVFSFFLSLSCLSTCWFFFKKTHTHSHTCVSSSRHCALHSSMHMHCSLVLKTDSGFSSVSFYSLECFWKLRWAHNGFKNVTQTFSTHY